MTDFLDFSDFFRLFKNFQLLKTRKFNFETLEIQNIFWWENFDLISASDLCWTYLASTWLTYTYQMLYSMLYRSLVSQSTGYYKLVS